MKTKLVYALTCKPEDNFIEMALISVYTARHYNPDATIIIIVDDLTDKLLVGKRAELLEYITEKLVVALPVNMNMNLRSRFLKTSFRNIVPEGDLLFIDTDTIITQSLADIDNLTCKIGAVLDSHLSINEYDESTYSHVKKRADIAGWDISKEKYYFSSGVIYVKQTDKTKLFFEIWHNRWLGRIYEPFIGDQPFFALANIECGHIIQKIDDTWNCVMYTQPLFDNQAKIMHFSSYKNMSYVFAKPFLEKVKEEGINQDFIKESILNPFKTYIPFDNAIYNFTFKQYFWLFKNISHTSQRISTDLNGDFNAFLINQDFELLLKKLFSMNLFYIGSFILIALKLYKTKSKKIKKKHI
jgi:hypothetical protein